MKRNIWLPIVVSLLFAAPALAAKPDLNHGKKIYTQVCAMCHASGIAGAPKFGDHAAWKDRIAEGLPTLEEHAIKGFNGMPPRGGNASLSDADVKDAVAYMVKNSQ